VDAGKAKPRPLSLHSVPPLAKEPRAAANDQQLGLERPGSAGRVLFDQLPPYCAKAQIAGCCVSATTYCMAKNCNVFARLPVLAHGLNSTGRGNVRAT
jgi:hypothetical protein